MARWIPLLAALPLALGLAACQGAQPTAKPSTPVADSTIRGTTSSNVLKSIVGAVEGFSNKRTRFPAKDGEKVVLELETENASKISGLGGMKIDPSSGSFTISGLVNGGNYFARAKFGDGHEEEALVVVERSNTNVIHPGSTLVAAWLRDQLGRKLIFLPDLPADKLQPMAATVQDILFEEQAITLPPPDTKGRLAKFDEMVAANGGLRETVRSLEAQFTAAAALYVRNPPSHTTPADYKAKVDAFTKSYGNPAGIGDPVASGS